MSKNKQWVKLRHRIIRNILAFFLYPYVKWKYHIRMERFKKKLNEPFLVLYNHQTAFDQFFVGLSFREPIYFLATEDIFSMGWLSSVIRYLVAPIPIKKQTLDISAVKNCIRIAKEGGSIAIAPEGNRTFSGKTEYINPSIAALAKKLNLPILLLRIEGGYGVHPRWGDVVRKGKMRSYVSEIITPDEYKNLSKDELSQKINNGLYVNEANDQHTFCHQKRAEFLERAIYICPFCGLSYFESNNDKITCKKCGKTVSYDITTKLHGLDFDLPFSFVSEWYDYQKDYINQFDLSPYFTKQLYCEDISLYEVIVYKKKVLIDENATISLYGNKIIINENKNESIPFSFDEIFAVTILGKNKLNIYTGKKTYQITGSKRFNALKYVHIYNRYKNVCTGDGNGKFLGL